MYFEKPPTHHTPQSPRSPAQPLSARDLRPSTTLSIFPTSVRGFASPHFSKMLRSHTLENAVKEPVFKYESPTLKSNLSATRNAISQPLQKANIKRRQQVDKLLQRERLVTTQKRTETEPTERAMITKSPVVARVPAALQLRMIAREILHRTEDMEEEGERYEPRSTRDMVAHREAVLSNQRKIRRQKALSAIKHFSQLQVPPFLIPKLPTLVPKRPFSSKYSLLFIMACRSGDTLQVIQYLELDRWLVLETDHVGQTGLHWAARRNGGGTMEVLVRMGAYIDARDQLGRTPLFLASQAGNLQAVRFLLSSRANPFLRTYQNQSPISISTNVIVEKLLMRSMQLVLLLKFAPASKRDGVWEKEGLGYFCADADVIKKS